MHIVGEQDGRQGRGRIAPDIAPYVTTDVGVDIFSVVTMVSRDGSARLYGYGHASGLTSYMVNSI
jgi:hypothetical protein